ncbi:unnamed protein product [Adineta steineri]|uniref:Caspase family p20 domain-containing protein n=1 Tax=Adineta steineri TaxID=433720 RepID=A0A815BR21_9BILA|nr:unnamed protein product [Adineta steineri]CAF1273489.1 unnamed protein product [Adineta steineri]
MALPIGYKRKIGLVIGINQYPRDSLQYCINDATDLSNTLQSVGFQISLGLDCNLNEFLNKIDTFIKTIQPDDLVLFYFAGHGKQNDDENYLLPSDYKYNNRGHERDYIRNNAINVKYIMGEIEDKKCRITIYLFDCCRSKIRTRDPNSKQGLLSMNTPDQTLIVFACAPGKAVLDETKNNKNGCFIENLLKHISTSDKDIEEVMRNVAGDVYRQTRGFQLPFRTSSLIDKVYLVTDNKQGSQYNSAGGEQKTASLMENSSHQHKQLDAARLSTNNLDNNYNDKNHPNSTQMRSDRQPSHRPPEQKYPSNQLYTKQAAVYSDNDIVRYGSTKYIPSSYTSGSSQSMRDQTTSKQSTSNQQFTHSSSYISGSSQSMRDQTTSKQSTSNQQFTHSSSYISGSSQSMRDQTTSKQLTSNQQFTHSSTPYTTKRIPYVNDIHDHSYTINQTQTRASININYPSGRTNPRQRFESDTYRTKKTSLLSKPPTYKNPTLEQMISENQNTSSVSFDDMYLTDADIELVAYYLLRDNKILTQLDLFLNEIGAQGAQYLGEALQKNTTLTTLNLRSNLIGAQGAQYLSPFKFSDECLTERKVIDTSGRLGSLYDTSTDSLIDRHSVQPSETKVPNKRSICRVFSGDQSREPTSFLSNIGFDDEVQRSIRLEMVIPSGIGRFIEYKQPINANTRFLYYCYKTRKETLHIKARKADRIVAPPQGSTEATHMITKIKWGIEILCVIQISRNQSIEAIDQLLSRISHQLQRNEVPVQLTNDDRRLINQLNNMAIYGSELCVDDPNTSLLTILNRIRDWQRNVNFHQPILYTMQPLRWLYNNIQCQEPCFKPDRVNVHLDRIEPMSKRIENQLKQLHQLFIDLPTNYSSPVLNEQLKEVRQKYSILLDAQENFNERLRKAIPDIRRNRRNPQELDHIISDKCYTCLHKNEIDVFRITIERLLAKATLIEKLTKNHIEYMNAFDLRPNEITSFKNEDIDIIIKRSCSNDKHRVILWYSSDRLKRKQSDRWEQKYQQIISLRHQTTQAIKLIYVDFTNCQQQLESFTVVQLPPKGRSEVELDSIIDTSSQRSRTTSVSSTSKQSLSSQEQERRSVTPLTLPSISYPTSPKTELNVLLLGETGVGKSTFINVFINYLKFDTLHQAERGQPIVLIPVSFLLTVGEQFDEAFVDFGDIDPNESYKCHGQSVTQQCKSYLFDLNDKYSIRLIDTPGIGDIRGIDQDIKSIDHILTYITNLSHINAICLLLKPNTSELNIFFRSCINQLITYISPIGYKNIIFCFTNSRATFYAPGDTGPLLQKMLIDGNLNIPFQKTNTFCFDSESFRYLAARKRHINFDHYQEKEYTDSWNTSATESIRLLDYIQACQPYYHNTWLSPKKAMLDISVLARPIMETLRLIIYNWKLNEAKLIFNHIILNSNPIHFEMCTCCAQTNTVEIGPFWITKYQRVVLKNYVNQHHVCSSNGKHFLVEAIVQHEFIDEPAGLRNERWQSSFDNFLLQCDRLIHYLRQQELLTHDDDPFQCIIERFLEEELQISQIRNINSNMNRKVREVLQSIKQKRQLNSQQLSDTNEKLSLNQIYQIINDFIAIPTIQKQLDSIKTSRQLKMKMHECKIQTNAIRNKTFSRLSNSLE